MKIDKLVLGTGISILAMLLLFALFIFGQEANLEQAITFSIGPDQQPNSPNLGMSVPSGTGAFVINTDGTQVGITFTYSDLTGPPAAMHVHNATTGENGGIVQTLCGNGPQPRLLESCPEGTNGTIAVVWDIPTTMLDQLLEGNLYVNIHTAQNGGGEIRGQMASED